MITKTPLELVKLLNVSLSSIDEILNQVYKHSIVTSVDVFIYYNSWNIQNLIFILKVLTLSLSFDKQVSKVSSDSFDDFLNENELFKKGILSEVTKYLNVLQFLNTK